MIRKQEWLEIFTRWEASGLSQTDFCKQNGINLKSFYARKAKYKNCWKSAQKTGSFTEVTQRAPPSPFPRSREYFHRCTVEKVRGPAPGQLSAASATFYAQLPDGTTLVFPLGADPGCIADILAALRSR